MLAENEQLRAAIEQRTADMALSTPCSRPWPAELDMQDIYDAVGDKIRASFLDADLDIRVLHPGTGLVEFNYCYDGGHRITIDPISAGGIFAHILETRSTLVVGKDYDAETAKLGATRLPGTSSGEKSGVWVPFVWRKDVRGRLLRLRSYERKHAFNPTDVGFLATLAGVLSGALQYAKLFDGTGGALVRARRWPRSVATCRRASTCTR